MEKKVNKIDELTLDLCNDICQKVFEIAEGINLHPLTVCILDKGGHYITLQRQDGSGILRPEIAQAKAYGALGMSDSSRHLGRKLGNREAFQNCIANASHGKFIAVPGGVLILKEEHTDINDTLIHSNNILGSIGISGDTSLKDEYCAIMACHHFGLATNPHEIHPDWNESHL